MAFTITHRMGDMEPNPPLTLLPKLLAELDSQDREHPDVAVSHESGWTLSAMANGHIFWENVEAGPPPRHMVNVPAAKIFDLWEKLAKGDLTAIESEPWLPDYGPKKSYSG